jgi:hypothetical protein
MSLALVIKNTILVILIILIVHFMVKNVLLEKSSTQGVPLGKKEMHPLLESKKEKVTGILKIESEPSPIDNPESILENKAGKPSSDTVSKVSGGLDKAKEELLKFIDDDDENLEEYFNKSQDLAPVPVDQRNAKSVDQPLPLNTTCDQGVQNVSRVDKPIKANCNFAQDKNVLILNEYDNESTMNGGSLFGGLGAYDAFDTNYQNYAC